MIRRGTGRATSAAKTQVFINYRSNDAGWAVHLDNVLSARFGADRVFRASRSIQPGEDFIDRILSTVAASKVLVAVIGPGWLTATDRSGGRALDGEQDWVRREIAHAFRQRLRVLPLLVDDAPPLAHQDLPDDIAQLARCQYLRVNYRAAETDTQRVGDQLVRLIPELETASTRVRRRRWLVAAVSLAAALLLSAGALAWINQDDLPGASTSASASGQPPPGSAPSGTPSRARSLWISLLPWEGSPTGVVQIKGGGFPANRKVKLSISTDQGWIDIGSAHTNEFGEFIATFDPRTDTGGAGRLAPGIHIIGTNSDEEDDPLLHTTAKYTVIA